MIIDLCQIGTVCDIHKDCWSLFFQQNFKIVNGIILV